MPITKVEVWNMNPALFAAFRLLLVALFTEANAPVKPSQIVPVQDNRYNGMAVFVGGPNADQLEHLKAEVYEILATPVFLIE